MTSMETPRHVLSGLEQLPYAPDRLSSSGAAVRAQLSPRVLMQVKTCDGRWCEVSLPRNGVEGYVDQSSLWGVYPGERFK